MTFTIRTSQHYVIDWDKVETIDDLKRILKAINFTFPTDCDALSDVRDLVRLETRDMGRMD